jgi:hypothetical protein
MQSIGDWVLAIILPADTAATVQGSSIGAK